ncbi:MAG TPA: hypothetical protein DEF45_07820 [Rhodopirellula sp.]|nr:MAG: hypothetical protein CBD74_01840 [Saprospirales bacterium TMED214]HBV62913.1 hypothetical protein [Rhodopirellula sp.]
MGPHIPIECADDTLQPVGKPENRVGDCLSRRASVIGRRLPTSNSSKPTGLILFISITTRGSGGTL